MTRNEFIKACAAGQQDFIKANMRGVNMSGVGMPWVDMSGADMRNADMSGAIMFGANVSGANMSGADMRNADMSGAILTDAITFGADMSEVNMSDADMSGANLSEADLSGANMTGANMTGANLSGANMSGANMRDANVSNAILTDVIGLPPAPVIVNLHTKMYAATSARNALAMHDWHTCDTTHCRAGWAIVLAGDEGASLEAQYGSCLAGVLIYAASYPDEPIPNFYASNADALADMKRLAEMELGQ